MTVSNAGSDDTPQMDVPRDEAVDWFRKAKLALDQGRARDAAVDLRKAIVIDPGLSYPYHFLGEARMHQGEHYEALHDYTRAFHMNGADLSSMMRAADLHAFHGRWDASELLARRVAGHIGDNPMLLYIWALSLYKLDRLDEAAAVLERVLQLDPNRLNARYYLGLCHRDRGDLEAALKCFAQVTRAVGSYDQAKANAVLTEVFFAERMIAKRLGVAATDDLGGQFAEQALAEARRAMQSGAYQAAARSFSAVLALSPDDVEAVRGAQECFAAWEQKILVSDQSLGDRHNEWFSLLASQGEVVYRRALAGTPAYYAPATAASPRRPRVFDGFMVSEELDVLELRLSELESCVDHFIVVESPWTHQGTPKRLAYMENKERFHRFAHKIIHVIADQRLGKLTWHQENYQREAILDGLRDAQDDDIVLVSDLDEIPRRDIVQKIAEEPRLAGQMLVLGMVLRAYFINFESYEPWTKAVALPVGLARRMGTNLARYITLRPPSMQIVKGLHNAGWHLTWMGGADSIIRKYRSYAHTEVSALAPGADEIRAAVASGTIVRHAYRRGRWIDHRASSPDTILRNPDRFRALGWIHEASDD
jgi:tetratricopeptide (TPR) repeat protein